MIAEPMEQTMKGKHCLITGGTAGLGWETARGLALRGARLFLVGRNQEAGMAAVSDLKTQTGNHNITYLAADLSEMNAVSDLADRYLRRYDRLDVLINNAGGIFGRRQVNGQGIEKTIALNHLAPFLLTARLLPMLMDSAPSRVVTLSSNAHKKIKRFNFENIEGRRGYLSWTAYKQSKLANLLFTYELARRLSARRVTANALHPGFVATDIGVRHGLMPRWLWKILSLGAIGLREGAQTPIYVASAPELESTSGAYFVRREPVPSSPASYDRTAQARLWQWSCERTRISPPV